MMRRFFSLFFLSCLLCASAVTQPKDSLQIGLIVCDPGPEIFELYGHQAVRVSGVSAGMPVDVIFNYGLFDFSSPGFVYRFVKGETDYMAGASPTSAFLSSYEQRGSRVTEYPLLLDSIESRKLLDLLSHDVQPAYASYRYKYFTNNCATRVLDNLEEALGYSPQYPGESNKSYRDMLLQYNEGYPWYQLGIDMALGTPIDTLIGGRESLFVPVEVGTAISQLRRTDGNALVGTPNVLVQGRGDMRQDSTPWYFSPLFIFWVVGAIFIILFIVSKIKGRRDQWLYSLYCTLLGLPGCVVWYLAFISVHEGTAPNWLTLWLSPLWLIPAVSIWLPSARMSRFTRGLMDLLGAPTLVFAVLALCGVTHLNPALIPMLLATLVMSCTIELVRVSKAQDKA